MEHIWELWGALESSFTIQLNMFTNVFSSWFKLHIVWGCRGFSLGPQDTWGWFQHLGTTEYAEHEAIVFTDWHQEFYDLVNTIPSNSGGADNVSTDDVCQAARAAAVAAFVDAHNTSYYVNSYTTKVNPTMDDVLCKLLDSVRRLKDEWNEREAQLAAPDVGGHDAGAPDGSISAATSRRREDFRRTMQVLTRFESSFRRASWKGGCEMVFPILFGHLSFMTHRCWTVYMKRAIFLAAESWRRRYGQLKTQRDTDPSNTVLYKLPTGETCALQGWRSEVRDGAAIYIGPDGEEFSAAKFAYEAHNLDRAGASGKSTKLRVFTHVLNNLKEGHCEDSDPEPVQPPAAQGHDDDGGPEPAQPPAVQGAPSEPTGSSVLAAAADVQKVHSYKAIALSQLDDWLHRSSHPIVNDMSLYVYSLWVYRVELPSFIASKQESDTNTGRHLDIPFDENYSAGKTWVQRLAEEPRLPNVQGFQFVSETPDSAEMHYLLKSALLRPAYLPDPDEEIYTKELRYLKAYEAFCTSPAGEEPWQAQRTGPDSPGPFQRGWTRFLAEQQDLALIARRKCLMHDCNGWSFPSIWNTREVAEALRAKLEATAAKRAGQEVCTDTGADEDEWPAEYPYSDMLTTSEYCALEVVRTAANFDGLATARSKKPPRQIEEDQKVPEQQQPVYWEGAAQDGEGDAQVEGVELRARQGLASLGSNAVIAHRFAPELLAKILAFDTAERTQAFVRQLKEAPLMAAGELPSPQETTATRENRREHFKETLLEPMRG